MLLAWDFWGLPEPRTACVRPPLCMKVTFHPPILLLPWCHSLVFQNSQAVCFMCDSPRLFFHSQQCGTRCLRCHCPGSSLSQLHPFVRVLTGILATVPKCRITVQRFRVGTHIAALSPSRSIPSDNQETIILMWLFRNSTKGDINFGKCNHVITCWKHCHSFATMHNYSSAVAAVFESITPLSCSTRVGRSGVLLENLHCRNSVVWDWPFGLNKAGIHFSLFHSGSILM